MKKENIFVKVSNSEVWEEMKEIKNKLDKLELMFSLKMDNMDLLFTNHLEHHKKFENNVKFYIPIAISIIFAIIQIIFYMLKK